MHKGEIFKWEAEFLLIPKNQTTNICRLMIFPRSFSGGFVIDIYSYENKNLSFRGFLGGKKIP
jgi:hypothetical protein